LRKHRRVDPKHGFFKRIIVVNVEVETLGLIEGHVVPVFSWIAGIQGVHIGVVRVETLVFVAYPKNRVPLKGAAVSGDFFEGKLFQFWVFRLQKIALDEGGSRHFKGDGYFRIDRRLQFESARFQKAGQLLRQIFADYLAHGKEKRACFRPYDKQKKKNGKNKELPPD
jgi:hypothetical protein